MPGVLILAAVLGALGVLVALVVLAVLASVAVLVLRAELTGTARVRAPRVTAGLRRPLRPLSEGIPGPA